MAIDLGQSKLKDLQKIIKSRRFLDPLIREARSIIYNRVKSGYGVDSLAPGASRDRLASLSRPYIETRKRRRLGPFGRPGKSNLTLTGQMLESMFAEVEKGVLRVVIPPTSRYDTKLNNAQVAEIVQEVRPFMQFTDGELRILERLFLQNLRKELIKLFK